MVPPHTDKTPRSSRAEATASHETHEPATRQPYTENAPSTPQPAARGAQTARGDYDCPGLFANLNELFARPVENPSEAPIREHHNLEHTGGTKSGSQYTRHGAQTVQRHASLESSNYDIPDSFANLDELAVSPIENPSEASVYEHRSLEQTRSQEREYARAEQLRRQEPTVSGQEPADASAVLSGIEEAEKEGEKDPARTSRLATQIYTLSYLVCFAIFGTLARLGLQALTDYPGTPVSFSSLWPNFGGSFVMGFLAEDRMLFRSEWGTPTYENLLREAHRAHAGMGSGPTYNGPGTRGDIDLAAAKRAHLAVKKTIPLYVGLATGFCGSFTSFSSFVRDIFLALSHDMSSSNVPRNGGYSFMAVLAVIILTVSLSLGGLFAGAHVAIALEPYMPSFSCGYTRKIIDPLFVVLGWGCWLGAVLLSILPPDRQSGSPETWRGRATFALVFAPAGCLCRFYLSLYLNGRIPSFPMGTFVVNMLGTLILGVSWDLAHVPLGGVVGCQVLQGIQDGFCGCLTTVSTWVAELSGLRRRSAYIYGTISTLSGIAIMVAVMGGLKWSEGFSAVQCVH